MCEWCGKLELPQRFPGAQPAGRAGAGAAGPGGNRGNGPAAAGSHGLHGERQLERREIHFFPLGSQWGREKGAGSSAAGMGLH